MRAKRRPANAAYVILFLVVAFMAIPALSAGDYHKVFYCAVSALLFMLPRQLERSWRMEMPFALEIIVLVFIFAAVVLGEVDAYYLSAPCWDVVLHMTAGFFCAVCAAGFADRLLHRRRGVLELPAWMVFGCAFCFAMTVGVLWEFFEFGMDWIFKFDMQKDTVIQAFTSVLLNRDGLNVAIPVTVESVTIGGVTFDGYLDIGLLDTMQDLLACAVGALAGAALDYGYVRSGGKLPPLDVLLPRPAAELTEPGQETAGGGDA